MTSKTPLKIGWLCKKHGKECKSYVHGIIKEWEAKGYTQKTLPKLEKEWLNLIFWSEKNNKV